MRFIHWQVGNKKFLPTNIAILFDLWFLSISLSKAVSILQRRREKHILLIFIHLRSEHSFYQL
jgi:hypothetical protein